jgi:hypothetical protein
MSLLVPPRGIEPRYHNKSDSGNEGTKPLKDFPNIMIAKPATALWARA